MMTILGVGVGIGTILFLVSLGYGLQKMLLERITTQASLLTLDVVPPEAKIVNLTDSAISKISHIDNVDKVSPLASFSGQANLGDLTSDSFVYGVFPSYFVLGGIEPSDGKLFSRDDERKAVLSTALLKTFNIEPSQAVGKQITFTLFVPKTGAGSGTGGATEAVTSETGTVETETKKIEKPYLISGIIEDDYTPFAYVPLLTLKPFNITAYSSVKVKVTKSKFMEGVRTKIMDMGFMVSALAETVDEANKIFRIIQIVLAIFGLIALLVAAIGMANTMTVTLLERTNEIGIMKAIGASNKDISHIFLAESVIMGFSGGISGIIIGFIGSRIFNLGVNVLARTMGGQPVNLFYTPFWFLLFIIVFSTLVGYLTGIFPARKAAKMNPLAALRYK